MRGRFFFIVHFEKKVKMSRKKPKCGQKIFERRKFFFYCALREKSQNVEKKVEMSRKKSKCREKS